MRAAKQALRLLQQNPVLWLPQLAAAVLNLLINTALMTLGHRASQRIGGFAAGAWLMPHYTARTPDLLVASETVKLPFALLATFLQGALVVLAVATTAHLARTGRKDLTAATRETFQRHQRAIFTAAVLLTASVLIDATFAIGSAAAFAYVPSLRPEPAWMLIVMFWTGGLLYYVLFLWLTVPCIMAAASAEGRVTERAVATARGGAFLALLVWKLFELGWDHVQGHWVAPRTDPGPFWRHPVTLGRPVFLFLLLVLLSSLAAVLTRETPPEQER